MTNDNKLSEHEKLEEIADKIGYTIDREFIYNVREIIFTPEFMDKFRDYRPLANVCCILNNLDNPVDYLYNLIKE